MVKIKLGLVRHFKVDEISAKKLSSQDYRQWLDTYDRGDVIVVPLAIVSDQWDRSYSSDLKRAIITAESSFKLKPIAIKKLREVRLEPFIETNRKISLHFWSVFGTMLWLFSKNDGRETYRATKKRINEFLDEYIEDTSEDRVLIYCHGFLIFAFQWELRKRKYKGPFIIGPKNGELFIFEKKTCFKS